MNSERTGTGEVGKRMWLDLPQESSAGSSKHALVSLAADNAVSFFHSLTLLVG